MNALSLSLGRSFAVRPDCVKGQVVCGSVYGTSTIKIGPILDSIVRVRNCIPVSDFNLDSAT